MPKKKSPVFLSGSIFSPTCENAEGVLIYAGDVYLICNINRRLGSIPLNELNHINEIAYHFNEYHFLFPVKF